MKIKVMCQINNYIIESMGTINDNIIKFNNKNSTISYDIKNLILTNDEYILNFYNRKCLFSNNLYIPVEILYISNNDEEKEYKIIYKIGDEKFTFSLKYEIIS